MPPLEAAGGDSWGIDYGSANAIHCHSVTVTFEAGTTRRNFGERFKTLSEASSYAEVARAKEDVQQIAIDFRLSERSTGDPIGDG
jgi:hypothetical protein